MKKKYEKPVFKRKKGLGFAFRAIREGWNVSVCRQCSGCHGCR